MLKDEYSTEWISPMKDIFVLNNVLEFRLYDSPNKT